MILDEILERKRHELDRARRVQSPEDLAREASAVALPVRGFRAALRSSPEPRIIAEIKRRSPSRGEIRPDFDPVACAEAYEEGGAAALSVLTDEHFFGGHLSFLSKLRGAVSLPLLRKDFTLDAYQVDEARVAGADAVLLIVAALTQEDLLALHARATGLSLDVLVEVHDEAQLERALDAGADLIGINNRDLKSFDADLSVTERLAPRIPEGTVVVAESGIYTPEDVRRLAEVGAHAFLVGESLMRQDDLRRAVRALRSRV
jgi:indole-3-glycerol phosphate synthase